MVSTRLCPALVVSALLSGCGYVHFGRLENLTPGGGDAAMATAYSNLSTEHKILKQELVLARREGDTLRSTLERGTGAAAADLVARLNDASKELATLRASYARLQSERTAGGTAPANPPRLSELEDKLAASLRNYTQLQEENARLRTDLDRTHGENARLGEQLKTVAAQHEQSRQALEMLNVELLAQKQARTRAEQTAEAMKAQLGIVLAQSAGAAPGSLTAARESTASSTAALHLSRSPAADNIPTAELRTDAERLRRAAEAASAAAPPPRPRAHVVQTGDTLEKIALKYYGVAEQWRAIHEANRAQLGVGQPLRLGMELVLP